MSTAKNRPNTWPLRPLLQGEDSSCQSGAVHTWPIDGAIASAAPVNGRMRNRCGSIKGSDDRRQCATNHPRKMTVAAQAALMPGECQPQSFTLTIAKTRDATPAVTSNAAPKWGCELLWPGTLGSFRDRQGERLGLAFSGHQ